MHSEKTMSPLQMYMLIILSIGISNHVLLIPVLLETGRRDAWVGVAAALAPILIWMGLVYVSMRATGRLPFWEWIGKRYGRAARAIVAVFAVTYLFAICATSLIDLVFWTQATYLPRTPRFAIACLFLAVCYFAAKAGLRAIAVASGVLLPGVVILGYFVATANVQYKDYTLLTPLFTQGYGPFLRSIAYTVFGLTEVMILLLFKHRVSGEIRLRGLLVLGFVLIGLTIGPVIGAISIFGPFEAAEQRYPAFEQWRMVTMGKFVSHLDFFSIFQWISGAFIRVSLLMVLIPDAMGFMKPHKRSVLLLLITVSLLFIVLLPFSDAVLLAFLSKWYFTAIFCMVVFVGLLLAALSLLPGKTKGEQPES